MKRLILTGALLLGGVLNAHADTQTYFFRDVLKPQGQVRGSDVRRADGVACGGSYDLDIPADNIPAFKRCMLSHGWKFDHIVTTRSPAPHQTGVYNYYDASSRGRGDAEEQAATLQCDGGNADNIATPAFKACMRAQGWHLGSFQPYAPHNSYEDEQDKRNEDASNDAERRADDQRQSDQWIDDLKNSQQQQQ